MAEQDDFDEWLDDVDTDDEGELDQLNIDALLSAVDEDAEPADPKASSSELDQTNIDALLGIDSNGTPSPETVPDESLDLGELDQDNIDALISGQDMPTAETASVPSTSDLDELDQDNIDALLGGANETIDELDQDNIDELDQDNIDALLSGSSSPAGEESQPLEDLDDLSQDNIDDLLAGGDTPEDAGQELAQDDLDDFFAAESSTPEPEGSAEVDQDDIDALFNDIDAATAGDDETFGGGPGGSSVDELFSEEDTGDETILSAEEDGDTAFDSEFDEMDQLFSELEEDSGSNDDPFQSEEIDFAEMLDSSDRGGEDEFLELDDEEEDNDEFTMPPPAAGDETDIDALLAADEETTEDGEPKAGIAIPAFIGEMSKRTLSVLGGTLALLLIIGFYFLLSGNGQQEETTVATGEQQSVEPPTPEENFIPLAEDRTYAMDNAGSGMAIELRGSDQDGQPLIYQITNNPAHGRLSGNAPNFTYLANNDFPGEDSFEYTVSDGVDTSAVAHVTITGPDLKAQALAQKIAEESRQQQLAAKVIQAKKPAVLAKHVHFSTESTTPVTIDWRQIWKAANTSDYDPKIHVEIVKAEAKGILDPISGSKTVFTPDPFSGGTDLIYYRFKKDGFRSATKTISIAIDLGNPAPEINFADLKQGYLVGQNVLLDVSTSRDDSPASLQFSWEQTSGVPVSMHIPQENGQKMAFVMPSSFYNEKQSGPTFRVTATDETGKTTSKDVKLQTISRRQAALWRGMNGDVAEEPAMEGKYFPWPYQD